MKLSCASCVLQNQLSQAE